MNFYAFHNSQEEAFRAPFGAVEEGTEVALSIITEGCLGAYQSEESPYYSWYQFRKHPDEYKCWWGFKNHPDVKEVFHSTMNLIGTQDTERVLTFLEERNPEKGKELLKLAIAFQMTFPGVPLIYYGDEAGMRGERDPKNRATYPWEKRIMRFLIITESLPAFEET